MDAVEMKEVTESLTESCGSLRLGFMKSSWNFEMEIKGQANLDEEIAQAAHLFDRLDSDLFDNPANNVIGI